MIETIKSEEEVADDILRHFAECDTGIGRVRADGLMVHVLLGVAMAFTPVTLDRVLRLAIARADTSHLLGDNQRQWVKHRLYAQLPPVESEAQRAAQADPANWTPPDPTIAPIDA
jgi:hypothetical protein